jgi:AraC family transcriptional regulator
MRNFLLTIPLIFLAAVIYLIFNLGVFKEVSIQESTYPEMILIYKDHVGPYHKIGDIIKEVEAWAKDKNINCSKSFGQYMDDPRVAEHERLRSRGGCIVDRTIAELPADLKTMTVPARNYYIATFGGSPWIGPYKVYRKVFSLAESQGKPISEPVIEIYELLGTNEMQTTYLFPQN